MADNINIDAGSTLTVATDEITGVHYQVVKVAHGADGAAAHASATAPLPVTVISATLGTVTVSLSPTTVTIDNSISLTSTKVTIETTGINVTPSTTASTITNAVGNPVNVSLTSTEVTVKSAVAGFNVNVATATLGTVTVTGTVTPSTTASTISNAVGNPVNVSLTSTVVTVKSAVAGFNVNVATATLGTVTVTGTVTPSTTASTITNAVGNPVNVSLTSTEVTVHTGGGQLDVLLAAGTSHAGTVSTIPLVGRTLTSTSGFLNSVTAGTLATGSNRIKVYGFSLTTTFAGEVICIFHTGGLELWRVDLAPGTSGTTAGANLAVDPPGFLFASRSGTAVTLSLSTAAIVHYSISYFDEA